MSNRIKSNICLFSAALIWGLSFVAQRDGMGTIGPFMFSAIRMTFGSITLLITMKIQERIRNSKEIDRKEVEEKTYTRKELLIAGGVIGVVFFFAANLQQVGMVYVDAGKAAFLTALYILIVPIMGLFLKHKATAFNWIGAVIGLVGLYFISVKNGFTVQVGDIIVLAGAFFWATHIHIVNYYVQKIPAIKLVFCQSLVCAVVSLVVSLAIETNTLAGIWNLMPNLLYSGILSAGFGFTLQALGQRHANPTSASIILCLESPFGAIFGALILHEIMSGRELFGCCLMMAAVIISQLPSKGAKKAEEV